MPDEMYECDLDDGDDEAGAKAQREEDGERCDWVTQRRNGVDSSTG